jgi:hypothetical protein
VADIGVIEGITAPKSQATVHQRAVRPRTVQRALLHPAAEPAAATSEKIVVEHTNINPNKWQTAICAPPHRRHVRDAARVKCLEVTISTTPRGGGRKSGFQHLRPKTPEAKSLAD